MTLSIIEHLANQLLSKTFTVKVRGKIYNVNPKNDLGYSFMWDNSKRRFGCCKYRKRKIGLSKPLSTLNLDKIDSKINDTILHEIAHAISVHVYGELDGRGHGDHWVSIAKQIGCKGERCYDRSLVNTVKHKYTLVCNSCNYEVNRHRKPSREYSCSKCGGGKFNRDYLLTIRENF